MALEQYGNTTTFNIESVLHKNIKDGEYFNKTCVKLTTFAELVDEIYYSVTHVEPWMSGNARGASSAFCLLFRLAQLKPSEDQVQELIDHGDSPYIRAVGFLYLRYVLNPRSVWEWIEPYLADPEVIRPSGEVGKEITMGVFVRDIFLDQYYFETLFPRVPKPVQDDVAAKLTARGLPAKAIGNAGQGGADRRGVDEPNRRPASVKASLSVAFGQRAPNRAAGREEGRGLGAGTKGAAYDRPTAIAQSTAPSPRPDRERAPDERPREDRGRDADRRAHDRPRDGDKGADRQLDREPARRPDDRDRRDYGGRGGSYTRDRRDDRDRDRVRDYTNGSARDSRDRGRDPRDYDRDRGRDRGADRDRDADRDRRPRAPRSRSRSADRDRARSGSRGVGDVFRSAAPRAGSLDRVKERY